MLVLQVFRSQPGLADRRRNDVTREVPAMSGIFDTIGSYFGFYQKYLMDHWHSMTPEKYGLLLIAIGVFGWLLMKNCTRASR
jgi:hypothetical protein